MSRYVRALERELEWIEPGTLLAQLFVGGGTPTALRPELLDQLLGSIFRRTTPFGENVHTVEASPETVSAAHIDVLRRHGIGRVSMGIQSLDDEVLDTVHRRHSRQESLAACDRLLDGGLILNVDLIFGLPRQSEESVLADIETIAARGVHSFTIYGLHLNERTPVAKSLRDEDHLEIGRLMRWRAMVQSKMDALGFTRTRNHTFKRLDSIASRHERLPHFDGGMFGYQFGAGMSARSHLGYVVYRNHDQLNGYMERIESDESPVERVLPMSAEDRKTQFVARTLGDGKGLSRSQYKEVFGHPIERDFGSQLARLANAGLIQDDGEHLSMTDLGKLVYDLVTLTFYPAHANDFLLAHEPRKTSRPVAAAASS
jgi:oxygen-independent coproporphyrinogen-3 oxidase